jgi:ABC-type glutathione transport system ATPase component
VQLVFEDASSMLDGHRTVQAHLEEAMSLGKGLHGSPTEWMERLGLSPRLLQAPADQLSASEGQRVDFARSLVVAPKLILFDAPEISGAAEDGGLLAAVFRAEKSQGRAFLVATSKPELARSLSDRVAVLYAGRIVELGSTRQVLERPGHPLTRAILSQEPIPEHDPTKPKVGCPFVSKCARRQLPQCDEKEPMLAPLHSISSPESGSEPAPHRVACFHPITD